MVLLTFVFAHRPSECRLTNVFPKVPRYIFNTLPTPDCFVCLKLLGESKGREEGFTHHSHSFSIGSRGHCGAFLM